MTDTQIMVLELAAKGYSCAQILLEGGLRSLGRENPDLLRAMGGLAQGGGNSGELCGALSGGFCLLNLYCGKGCDQEQPDSRAALLQDELLNWFRVQPFACKGITCSSLLEDPSRLDPTICGSIIAEVWDEAMRILVGNDFDPTQGKDL